MTNATSASDYSNTYTQFHLQFIFAPKYRLALIDRKWAEELHRYITALVQERSHKMLCINSEPDHIHFFIGYRPSESIPDLMERVKSNASRWINDRAKTAVLFAWQRGYGGFSYRKSDVPQIIHYILHQQEHHRKVTFLEEYEAMLEEFGVDYNPLYLFKAPR